MSQAENLFTELISQIEGAELGQLFGKACGKLNKKAFIIFFENEIVFKIGKEATEERKLSMPETKNFDPSGKGRAMKDWLQVPITYKKHYKKLLDLSLEFTFPLKQQNELSRTNSRSFQRCLFRWQLDLR